MKIIRKTDYLFILPSTTGPSFFDTVQRRRPFKKSPQGEYTAIDDKTTPADLAGIMRKNPSNAVSSIAIARAATQ